MVGNSALVLTRFLLTLLVLTATPARAENLSGQVVGITDGDTLTVLVNRQPLRVRLAEIDTPERGQPWANRAKQALSDKVFGKQVELRVVGTNHQRTVAHLYLGPRHINGEMVREGYAWVDPKYLRDPSLSEDEAAAREARIGLWSLPMAQTVPPWEWRAGERLGLAGDPTERASGCGSKRYCREMASCEEARFYLERCGLTTLDGDGDGVPCEALCR